MKLAVIDGNGVPQTIVANGVAAPVDRSGVMDALNEAKVILAANADRGGWLFQNLTGFAAAINEIGDAGEVAGSFQVEPLGFWPPAGYPVTVGAVSLLIQTPDETDLDTLRYTAREW